MKRAIDQKFMDMIMEKICEKYFIFKNINKGDEIYKFNIDDFIKDIRYPIDPEEGGMDIAGLGPLIWRKISFLHYKEKKR